MVDENSEIAIVKAEKAVNEDVKICEQYMDEFMSLAVKFCAEKMDYIFEERIIKEPKITKKNGDKELHELLSKKDNLLAELPNNVNKEVGIGKIWKHRIIAINPEYEDISDYFLDIYDFKRDIKKAMGRVLGYGVELLLDYNYFKKKDTVTFYKYKDNEIMYTGELEFTNEMDINIANYLHSYHSLYSSFIVLADLKQKKSEQEAADLLKRVKKSLK